MLKRLELVGFKSFADKTEFVFAPGVTAIVGPNGSGKSNIIDAVRWVLGEQSAKSLRGGEMTDVIFNGSACRRSLGLAEVSMTFDNTRRQLATEADEVRITRRVYRSGEGEYLINRQNCRLKDIKDLFLGSGAGAHAYSIIEQGRVDILLQASTKDRRSIFEEAAGISRFKARKIETLRRLERVGQDLTRLRDILDEVEKQLRSVKLQAAKAQRYQEYSARLQTLRVALGLQEFDQLSGQFAEQTAALEQFRAALREQLAQGEACEAELQDLEVALGQVETTLHEHEANLANAREQIATHETTMGHESGLIDDIEAELTGSRQRLTELLLYVGSLIRNCQESRAEVQTAEANLAGHRQGVADLENALRSSEEELHTLAAQIENDKADHLEGMRESARLQNDAVSYQAQFENLTRERQRLCQRTEQAAEHLASLEQELQQLTGAEQGQVERLTRARTRLAELRQEQERFRQLRDETQQRISDLRAERSGLVSRIEILEGLERSHEGLGTGVREVYAHLEQPDPGPWRTVRGILADLLSVRRDFAPLIDLALGERAERFVVENMNLLDKALTQRGAPFSGRVSFLPVGPLLRKPPREKNNPNSRTEVGNRPVRPTRLLPEDEQEATQLARNGVVALAAQVVHMDDPDLADLPQRLLGQTFVVRDLVAARAVAKKYPGCRCVTLHGELVEADGTVTVGTHHAESGILSRKSELRELREQLPVLDNQITELENDLRSLREGSGNLEAQLEQAQAEIEVLAEQLTDLRSRLGEQRQRRQGLHEEVSVAGSEIRELEEEIEDLQSRWQQAREQASAAEARVQALQVRMQERQQESRQREQQRQQLGEQAVQARVAEAQAEERLAGLRARHARAEGELTQREDECARASQQVAHLEGRHQESQATLLRCSTALAHWYLVKEAAEQDLARGEGERTQLRQVRQARAEQAQISRSAWQEHQEKAHALELEVNDLRHRRDTLCTRLQEDYQLDLAALYETWRASEEDRETGRQEEALLPLSPGLGEGWGEGGNGLGGEGERLDPRTLEPARVNEEIAELRRKLSRLGSVNLEALNELTDLEARYSALHTQFEDLNAARRVHQEIIDEINEESRRLFSDTLVTVRGHFQELFRKLFGGGMADVLLEDETDVLESGIEVMARPPGKELRSISLMSGGEKTLTAVALLLAIFKSKPSPFCLLDEVDAALDEANIGRFTAVLRDFLELSQFIIITHSKSTMTCADVLYGITMQESGISTRISVRFEDWPEQGAG